FISYKERKFSRHEVDFLSSIGNQVATAIAKAKLYRELSKKNRYETIISTVTQSVHRSINLQEVLENAVDTMSKNIDRMHHVAIYMVEGKEAVLRAYRGLTGFYIEQAGRIPYPKGITWRTIMEEKPIYIEDAEKDMVIGSAGKELGLKSCLCVPIHDEDKTVGSLNITSFQKSAFNEEELNLLKIIARQIEIAINNAQIAEALRQSKERYQILFDQSPVGVYIFNKDFKIIHCNESLVRILRTSYNKLVGLDLRKLRSRRILSLIEKVFEGQSSTYEGLYQVKGSTVRILVSIRLSPLRSANGKVIGGMAVIEDITERKHAEEQLKNSREQLRSLAAHLESIREEERTRIALEIHDGLSQSLTGLKMGLSWLDKKLFESGNLSLHSLLIGEITNMSNIIETTFQLVQEISTELRPKILDDLGLIPAIEWQTQEFQTRMGIRCKFTSNLDSVSLGRDQSTAIFRILQESLTNVARHANATRVEIKLKKSGGSLVLEVKDNGKGITEGATSDPKSFGLMGMRERALLLEGEVIITGAPGKGTKIVVRIPFKCK
ncbi:MAG TPA: GAF domain-containing protein, partial [Thermodesulfobacteriota bacterium]|nr:GAF domain-containing protein [Thermodesulfobacteriota bacterium]